MTIDVRRRLAALSVIVVVSIGIGGGYAFYALKRSAEGMRPQIASDADRLVSPDEVLRQPRIVFRDTTVGPTYGNAAAVTLKAPGGARTVTETACDRLYSVGKVGFCLTAKRSVVTTFKAHLLDSQLKPGREFPTSGEPSRVRVSADGRRAATTTFVAGHSYASSGFSTRTMIYDLEHGKASHNIQDFTILHEGKPYKSIDVNVWGVTFKRDTDDFFATMATRGTTYLVEGSISGRTLTTVKEGVECPSLSPDQTRVAYKKREDSRNFSGWRVHILDLETGADFAVAGKHNVDDQVEWLDDRRVMYGLARKPGSLETDVWVVPADGSGKPSVLIKEAWSPAVVRSAAG